MVANLYYIIQTSPSEYLSDSVKVNFKDMSKEPGWLSLSLRPGPGGKTRLPWPAAAGGPGGDGPSTLVPAKVGEMSNPDLPPTALLYSLPRPGPEVARPLEKHTTPMRLRTPHGSQRRDSSSAQETPGWRALCVLPLIPNYFQHANLTS